MKGCAVSLSAPFPCPANCEAIRKACPAPILVPQTRGLQALVTLAYERRSLLGEALDEQGRRLVGLLEGVLGQHPGALCILQSLLPHAQGEVGCRPVAAQAHRERSIWRPSQWADTLPDPDMSPPYRSILASSAMVLYSSSSLKPSMAISPSTR